MQVDQTFIDFALAALKLIPLLHWEEGQRGGGTTSVYAAGNLLSLTLSSQWEERGLTGGVPVPTQPPSTGWRSRRR